MPKSVPIQLPPCLNCFPSAVIFRYRCSRARAVYRLFHHSPFPCPAPLDQTDNELRQGWAPSCAAARPWAVAQAGAASDASSSLCPHSHFCCWCCCFSPGESHADLAQHLPPLHIPCSWQCTQDMQAAAAPGQPPFVVCGAVIPGHALHLKAQEVAKACHNMSKCASWYRQEG